MKIFKVYAIYNGVVVARVAADKVEHEMGRRLLFYQRTEHRFFGRRKLVAVVETPFHFACFPEESDAEFLAAAGLRT